MFRARGATILLLTVGLAAFTFGCSSSDGGSAGAGGTAGSGGGGSGGDGGMGGGGMGGDGGMGGMGGEGGAAGIRADFEVSLHKTREGKNFWYSAANNGMQSQINVAYDDFVCKDCHNKQDDSWAGEATCADCHDAESDPPKHLQASTCLGCHGRQNAEAGKLQEADFHASTYSCSGCHKSNDVHGNGTEYDTMLRPGAIAVRCTDCHGEGVDGAPDPPSDNFHGSQHGSVDCALCHTETVISCINCHLEEDLDNQQKCASAQIFNWKFVMKWDKEGDGNEVYTPATMMTLKYNCDRDANPVDCTDQAEDPKKSFAVFAPYYAHTVTQAAIDNILAAGTGPFATDGCGYCHGAENCDTIVNAGQGMNPKQKLIEFDGTKLSNPISGLIPLPDDFRDRFLVDYVEWAEGAGTGCQMPPQNLVLFETGPDLWQTGDDATAPNKRELGAPLTQAEFEKFCPAP